VVGAVEVVVEVVVVPPEQDIAKRTPMVSRISKILAGTSNLLAIFMYPSVFQIFYLKNT
jgi:hypothetical protein